jgi:hypothetical protein
MIEAMDPEERLQFLEEEKATILRKESLWRLWVDLHPYLYLEDLLTLELKRQK